MLLTDTCHWQGLLKRILESLSAMVNHMVSFASYLTIEVLRVRSEAAMKASAVSS